jgi:hypothetical protein
MAGDIKITLSVKDDGTPTIQRISGELGKMQGAGTRAASGMTDAFSVLKGALGAVGLVISASEAVRFLKSSTTAALDASRSFEQMKFAVNAATDDGFSRLEPAIKAATQAAAQYAIVQENEVQRVLQTLVTNTGDLAGSLKHLSLVFDIATAKNLDAAQAAKFVSLAMTGNAEALSRLLPEFRQFEELQGKNLTLTEKAAATIGLLTEKFTGATAAMGEHVHMLKQGQKEWNDFTEDVGKNVLIFFSHVVQFLKDIKQLSDSVSGSLEKAFSGIGLGGGIIRPPLAQVTEPAGPGDVARAAAVQQKAVEAASKGSVLAHTAAAEAAKARATADTAAFKMQQEALKEYATDFAAHVAFVEQAAEARGAADLEASQMAIQAEQQYLEQFEKDVARLEAIDDGLNKARIMGEVSVMNEKIRAAEQSTAFIKTQLQDLVASNTFSLSSIVSTWTSSIAQMIVHGGNLKAAWEATQVALVQTALNTGVQMVARWALDELKRVAATQAANATIAASNTATAAISVSTLSAAAASVGAAIAGMASSVIASLVAIWGVARAVLASIAAAMKATIFGIPVGVAITAALIAGSIAVASASTAAAATLGALAAGSLALTVLQHGGVVTGPTLALLGEAGPEAVVPLGRGGFMGPIDLEVPLYLDGREIARATIRHWPRAMWGRGIPAV